MKALVSNNTYLYASKHMSQNLARTDNSSALNKPNQQKLGTVLRPN